MKENIPLSIDRRASAASEKAVSKLLVERGDKQIKCFFRKLEEQGVDPILSMRLMCLMHLIQEPEF